MSEWHKFCPHFVSTVVPPYLKQVRASLKNTWKIITSHCCTVVCCLTVALYERETAGTRLLNIFVCYCESGNDPIFLPKLSALPYTAHASVASRCKPGCLAGKSALQGVVNLPCKLISVTDSRLKAWCNPTPHLCNVFYEPSPASLFGDWFIHGAETQLTESRWATKSFIHFIAGGRVFIMCYVLVSMEAKGSFSLLYCHIRCQANTSAQQVMLLSEPRVETVEPFSGSLMTS